MNKDQRQIWDKFQELIAQYDWAVEGFPPPEGAEITDRAEAVEKRNNLVKDLTSLIKRWEKG